MNKPIFHGAALSLFACALVGVLTGCATAGSPDAPYAFQGASLSPRDSAFIGPYSEGFNVSVYLHAIDGVVGPISPANGFSNKLNGNFFVAVTPGHHDLELAYSAEHFLVGTVRSLHYQHIEFDAQAGHTYEVGATENDHTWRPRLYDHTAQDWIVR